jgi:hypothetical protein
MRLKPNKSQNEPLYPSAKHLYSFDSLIAIIPGCQKPTKKDGDGYD